MFTLRASSGFLFVYLSIIRYFAGGSTVMNQSANAGDVGSIPESGRSLETEMATYSTILAWEIPRTVEPGRL